MTTTFDRYLLHRFLHVFVVLFVTTFGLFVIIDGFTNIDGFQENAEGFGEVLMTMGTYYAYQSIVFYDLVAAIVAVVSVVVVFALLIKHSELQPVLAAGVPTYRLVLPFLIGVALINATLIANQELVIPKIAHQFAPRKQGDSLGHEVEPAYDHKTHVHIAGKELFLAERKMTSASFTLPVPKIVRELTTLRADHAIYLEEIPTRPAGWMLYGVEPPFSHIDLVDDQPTVRPGTSDGEVFVASEIGFDQLSDRTHSSRYLSTAALIRRIRNPSSGNETKRGQILYFHTRLTQPIINLLAVMIAVPLVVRRESRSLIGNMAICAGVLSLMLGFNYFCGYLAGVSLISTALAAWLPVIANGTLGAWLTGFAQT